jgi:exosortase A-associated hydrolase 2
VQPRPEAFFHQPRSATNASRFVVWSAPAIPVVAMAVYVHPWAEEMNKSRRMVALQSRAFAAAGIAVLQMDRLGCGDSDGDTGDADWDGWVQDVLDACALMLERTTALGADVDRLPLWLWGLRGGCLLATEAAARLPARAAPTNLLFWQPALAGRSVLQQFLRLDSVASRLGKTGPANAPSAQQRLASGETVQIAGYDIAAGLARGLESARLTPVLQAGRVAWFDVTTQPDAAPAPATHQALQAWTDAGVTAVHQRVIGPAFWQTVEIEEAPALLAATTAALRAPGPAA